MQHDVRLTTAAAMNTRPPLCTASHIAHAMVSPIKQAAPNMSFFFSILFYFYFLHGWDRLWSNQPSHDMLSRRPDASCA
jgi:hypothetical protein